MTNPFKHHKYTLDYSFGYMCHDWRLVGPNGGINFHISISDAETSFGPTAGLEFHDLSGEGAPDHVDCPLTGGRCWHDGTSLYATESVWPLVQSYLRVGDHKSIFRTLESEYNSHFRSEEGNIGSGISAPLSPTADVPYKKKGN